MRLAPEAIYQHDWQGLAALRVLLKGRSGPPHYLSNVDPRMVNRIGELLKMHDLCVCVLADLRIQERDMQLKAHTELLGIAEELHRVSAHFSKGSHEIVTLANRLMSAESQLESGLPAPRQSQGLKVNIYE